MKLTKWQNARRNLKTRMVFYIRLIGCVIAIRTILTNFFRKDIKASIERLVLFLCAHTAYQSTGMRNEH